MKYRWIFCFGLLVCAMIILGYMDGRAFAGSLPAGDWDYCNPTRQCPDGIGDCDTNEDCLPGCVCQKNVGPDYGWKKGVDVCVSDGSAPGNSSNDAGDGGLYGGGVGGDDNGTSPPSTPPSTLDCSGLNYFLNSACQNTDTPPIGGGPTHDCSYYFPNGHPEHCATCGPCVNGEGKCYDNDQCLSGYCNMTTHICQEDTNQ